MLALKNICITPESTLEEALKNINQSGIGICFVCDSEQHMKGVLTDGDIRRALLGGRDLQTVVNKVVSEGYVYGTTDMEDPAIIGLLNDRIRAVPILDGENRVVDFASRKQLHNIPILSPILSGNEMNYVVDCIKTGWISSIGKYVSTFEENFAEYIGTQYAIAVSNGTVALKLALEAYNIGRGDEVIVPDLTFAASVNAIIHAGATPVLVDVDKDTATLMTDRIEELITPKTRAIMPVHLFGHPAEMNSVNEIAEKHGLRVIEDCAEAVGSLYHGKPVGTTGDCGCFSFFGNKTITTGEGGMIVTSDKQFYHKAVKLRDHGMSREKKYWHDLVGFNYRMTNLQAAVGVAQLERADEFVSRKREIAAAYNKALRDREELVVPVEVDNSLHSYWLYVLRFAEGFECDVESWIKRLGNSGIEARPVFYPMHEMPVYGEYTGSRDYPNSETWNQRGMCLPSSAHLSDEELAHITGTIISILESEKIISET